MLTPTGYIAVEISTAITPAMGAAVSESLAIVKIRSTTVRIAGKMPSQKLLVQAKKMG
jgi:hypothetical protein